MSRSWFPATCAIGMVLLLSGCGPADTLADAPAPVADVVTVIKVVDGDTVDVSDGRTVRMLGIDACEAGTDAGNDATVAAAGQLLGKPVTLTAEPAADRDPYGRVLRYVQMPDGQDFGTGAVPFPHTAVYEGGGAGAGYMATLRTLDADGRTCDRPDPAPTSTATPPPVEDDVDRPYVPVPDVDRPYVPAPDDDSRPSRSDDSGSGSGGDSGSATKPRTGNSGHPCLPGERDGDDDGFCGEGR